MLSACWGEECSYSISCRNPGVLPAIPRAGSIGWAGRLGGCGFVPRYTARPLQRFNALSIPYRVARRQATFKQKGFIQTAVYVCLRPRRVHLGPLVPVSPCAVRVSQVCALMCVRNDPTRVYVLCSTRLASRAQKSLRQAPGRLHQANRVRSIAG